MQRLYSLFVLTLLLPPASLTLEAPTTSAQHPESNDNLSAAKLPTPPNDPPPNQRTPGGGLNPFRQACKSSGQALTAIIPVNQTVVTAQAHPTFLIYIPDLPEDIHFGELSILTEDEKIRLHKTRIRVEDTPGIISINLPIQSQFSLKTGKLYRWYFKLYCQSGSNKMIDLDVNGWLQHIDNSADTPQHFWHDIASSLANRLQTTPEDPDLKKRWHQLLTDIDLGHLSTAPLLPASEFSEQEFHSKHP